MSEKRAAEIRAQMDQAYADLGALQDEWGEDSLPESVLDEIERHLTTLERLATELGGLML